MKKLKNQKPSIRFKEFSYNWPQVRMGDILKIGSGKDYKHLNPGDIPVFGSGGYMTSVDEAIYSGETVFIGRKGSIDKPFYYNGAFWTVDTLFYTRDFKKCVPKFVYCLFQNINWYKYNEASGVPSLSKKTIESIIIDIPSLPEQQKIASFLSKVDEKITLLTKKKELLEEYKKGVTQKIFKQEIRFKDEQGNDYPAWIEFNMGDIGKTINGLSGKTKNDFGEGKPYIQYMQIFSGSKIDINNFGYVDIKPNENQSKVRYGDVFFTTSSETPNEIGTASVLLDKVNEVYLNSLCFGYRPNSFSVLVPEFAQFLFRCDIFRRKIIPLAQGSTRFNLSKVELMKTTVLIPSIHEQNKIADFLSTIDKKISAVDQQLSLAKEWKKGLLQKMFV